MEKTVPEETEQKLKEAGDELRARHDEAVIADVIGEVRELDKPGAAETADLLRFMVSDEE